MKQKYLFIFLTLLSAVFACEQIDESNLGGKETVEMVPMSFTAVIEKDADTKTVLGDGDSENLKKVLWQPGDKIGVSPLATDLYYTQWSDVSEFTSTLSESSKVSEFDGSAAFASAYKAFYPYTETVRDSNNVFIFDMPATQKYVNGSFDPEAAPMVAYAERGNDFEFKNVCGIVALKLTGDKAVKSISFSGVDANGSPVALAGTFEVEAKVDEPVMKLHTHSTGKYTVTLDCGETVQLDPSVAKPFYIMLPPATYSTFSLLITTADGEIMLKSGRNLTIARSHIKPTAGLEYVESVYVDLSAKGTANSYIVPPTAGLYSFDATTIGNGEFGLVADAGFHTDNTNINPVSAALLWCDTPEAITGVSYADGRIGFMSTGLEGNAVIAAKDAQDNILWSWHIWMTDQPAEHVYVNSTGSYTVLDRNLGATRADRGTGNQWKEARGLAYQWGRKDPFVPYQFGVDYGSFTPVVTYKSYASQATVAESISNPDCVYYGNSNWNSENNVSLWVTSKKTIYDPCPSGYMVAYSDVWRSFTTTESDTYDYIYDYNVTGTFDNGWDFIYNQSDAAYYPVTWTIGYYGNAERDNTVYCDIWTSQSNSDANARLFRYYYGNDADNHIIINGMAENKTYGHMVRCVKEDNTLSAVFNEVSEITSTSARFSGTVAASSNTEVTMKGFVYGNSEDVTIESGTVIECGSGCGTFTADANGLEGGLYYVRAYAVTSSGTYYSPATYFIAKDIVNESEKDMVFTVSANYTNNFFVKLPTWGTIQCTVDWGDGTVKTYDTDNSNLTHTYSVSEPSYFDVRISGVVTELHNNSSNNSSITKVKQWGLTGLTSMAYAFGGESMLTELCDDALGSFIDVASFDSAWSGCSALAEIPDGLFRYAIQATDFENAFEETAINNINSDLFVNCSSVQTLDGIFRSCTELISINGNLFAGCSTATDIDNVFYECSNLSSIPSGIFDSFTNAKTFSYTFYDCSSITSIPTDLFEKCTEIERFEGCFASCTSLTAIPEELFKNNVKATDFSWVFGGCSSLTAIPEGLFSNLTNATTFDYSFSSCGIESLPTGLFKDTNAGSFSHTFAWCDKLKTTNEVFDGCSQVLSFHSTFNWCVALTNISENLFSSCTSVKNFNNTFYYCTSLESIPANLFSSCTLVESFNSTFCECHKLTSIPVSLFDRTRRVRDFGECFYLCRNLTGESPYTIIDGVKYHLYERANNIEQFVTPTYSYGCFGYCRGLTDYYSIPGDWN